MSERNWDKLKRQKCAEKEDYRAEILLRAADEVQSVGGQLESSKQVLEAKRELIQRILSAMPEGREADIAVQCVQSSAIVLKPKLVEMRFLTNCSAQGSAELFGNFRALLEPLEAEFAPSGSGYRFKFLYQRIAKAA